MAGKEVGTFNDRPRDIIRGASLFNSAGSFNDQAILRLGLAGPLADYMLQDKNGNVKAGSSYSAKPSYGKDPADIINYVSKHDNETLWDQLQYGISVDMNIDQRVRIQNITGTMPFISQGIPFFQMGGDLLRSKSMDRNTYDAGDWYNKVDFTFDSNNWNVGYPLDQGDLSDEDLVSLAASPFTDAGMTEMEFASNVFNEFLEIRQTSKLFRLTTAQDIIERVGFHNIGKRQTQNLIVMSIDDGTGLADLDTAVDAIVVVVNGSDSELSHTVATAAGFELHTVQQNSVDTTIASASFAEGDNEGTFTVPALSVAVFVKPQGDTQGTGLAATATAGAPDVVPYGDTAIFVRGEMNSWGTDNALTYIGGGVYESTISLAAGTYIFKVADGDWSSVNLGSPADTAVIVGTDKVLVPGSNDNMSITITEATDYIFSVDASDTANPVLNVRYEAPYYGTSVYLRGDMNGWGTSDELSYLGNGQYSVTVNITEAKDYYFKMASDDWSTVNIGGPSDDLEVLAGEEQLMVTGSNDNLFMNLSAGEYTFILNAKNSQEITLTVYSAEMFGATTAFIRGEMNGWGEVDSFVYQGNGIYSVDIALTAASYNFKVASGDWSTINLGGDAADLSVAIDTPYQLIQGSNDNLNIVIAEDATYTFSVVGPNPNTATLTVTKK